MAYQMQFGVAEEVTYGTPVTVNRFFEFLPGETLDRQQTVLNSQALRKGRTYGDGSKRVITKRSGGGSIGFEVGSNQFGLFFKHMLGSVATVQPDAGNSPTVYMHTFTPGTLIGKSMTLQKGVEKVDGTAQAFTFHGSKITEWEIGVGVDEMCVLNLTFDAEDVDTSTGLAVASYTDYDLFHFGQGVIKVGGATIGNVSSGRIRGINALNVERYFLGQLGLKSEPLEADLRQITGEVTAQFANLTDFYNRFTNDTPTEIIMEFVGPVISDDETQLLRITVADVRLTGEVPKVSDADVATSTLPFEAYAPAGGGPAITIEYQTTDTTP